MFSPQSGPGASGVWGGGAEWEEEGEELTLERHHKSEDLCCWKCNTIWKICFCLPPQPPKIRFLDLFFVLFCFVLFCIDWLIGWFVDLFIYLFIYLFICVVFINFIYHYFLFFYYYSNVFWCLQFYRLLLAFGFVFPFIYLFIYFKFLNFKKKNILIYICFEEEGSKCSHIYIYILSFSTYTVHKQWLINRSINFCSQNI